MGLYGARFFDVNCVHRSRKSWVWSSSWCHWSIQAASCSIVFNDSMFSCATTGRSVIQTMLIPTTYIFLSIRCLSVAKSMVFFVNFMEFADWEWLPVFIWLKCATDNIRNSHDFYCGSWLKLQSLDPIFNKWLVLRSLYFYCPIKCKFETFFANSESYHSYSFNSIDRVPLWLGTTITIVDAFTFLMVDRFGLRKLETLFGVLISIMAITFGFEVII